MLTAVLVVLVLIALLAPRHGTDSPGSRGSALRGPQSLTQDIAQLRRLG
jgi:hypothetical protein